MEIKNLNIMVLAYLGDSVYECYVRNYLVLKYQSNVDDIRNISLEYVSGLAQANIIDNLIEKNFLTEEELDIYYRARNYKKKTHPKNIGLAEYKKATALEAIVGALYLSDQNRLNELLKECVKEN